MWSKVSKILGFMNTPYEMWARSLQSWSIDCSWFVCSVLEIFDVVPKLFKYAYSSNDLLHLFSDHKKEEGSFGDLIIFLEDGVATHIWFVLRYSKDCIHILDSSSWNGLTRRNVSTNHEIYHYVFISKEAFDIVNLRSFSIKLRSYIWYTKYMLRQIKWTFKYNWYN